MTAVTVPVAASAAVPPASVHAALAEDVKEIFTEIYNDPEHFPIHDGRLRLAGRSPPASTTAAPPSTSTPTRITRSATVRCWLVLLGAGNQLLHHLPDSSVVRIFCEHGWSWGGDAWAYSDDSRATTTICTSAWESDQQPTRASAPGGFQYPPLD